MVAEIFCVQISFEEQELHGMHLYGLLLLSVWKQVLKKTVFTLELQVLRWTHLPLTVFITWSVQFLWDTTIYHVTTFVIGQASWMARKHNRLQQQQQQWCYVNFCFAIRQTNCVHLEVFIYHNNREQYSKKAFIWHLTSKICY